MTVHGAKGLQAPMVILADAASDPEAGRKDSLDLITESGAALPLLRVNKELRIGKLGAAADYRDIRELAEFYRLLYVALTRAQERLIVTGSLGRRRKEVPEKSWYAVVQLALEALGGEWVEDVRWGRALRHVGIDGEQGVLKTDDAAIAALENEALPQWMITDAPGEQRPPRPLTPSRLDDDEYGDAPVSPAMRAAGERGKLIHALFERIEDGASLEEAGRWLAVQCSDAIDRDSVLAEVRGVVGKPEWADFFGPDARAEVPIAAVVGEIVVSGRIDRLVVTPDRIRILDFKTGRGVPADADSVPVPHLRQMAHYVAALEVIFPGTVVDAALLFTHAPKLLELPDELLARYKPLSGA